MSRSSRVLAVGATLAGILAVATAAGAQGGAPTPQGNSVAEARLAWAKRHVELVCRPLEAQKMFDKATRCYNDVARLMAASSEKPAATAESAQPAQQPAAQSAPTAAPAKPRPAARPAPVRAAAAAKPAPVRVAAVSSGPRAPVRPIAVAQNDLRAAPAAAVSSRCSGIGCLKYTLLGVGF
jgi:hypothetical protein